MSKEKIVGMEAMEALDNGKAILIKSLGDLRQWIKRAGKVSISFVNRYDGYIIITLANGLILIMAVSLLSSAPIIAFLGLFMGSSSILLSVSKVISEEIKRVKELVNSKDNEGGIDASN